MESPLRTSSPLDMRLAYSTKDIDDEEEEHPSEHRKEPEVTEEEKKDRIVVEEERQEKNPTDTEENEEEDDDEEYEKKGGDESKTKTPLITDDSVKIDIRSKDDEDNTATLPLKKDPNDIIKENPPIYLFPFTRLKIAWTSSSGVCEFFVKAVFIIFSTLGWLFCIGGIPLMSLAMLIIGAIYKDDCPLQPNIPIYLIVAGVLGTVQHFIAIWTKYLPKESQGRLRTYRAYCKVMDSTLHLFLFIWFVLGCIWVYGAYDRVDYEERFKDEFCDKTLYLFSFWMLNISFILLAVVFVCGLCCILCIAATKSPRTGDEEDLKKVTSSVQ